MRSREHEHHKQDGPERCKYEPRSAYPVRLEATAEDNSWKTKQEGYWTRQIRIAKWLNIITSAVGVTTLAYVILTYKLWDNAKDSQKAWVGITEPVADSFTYENRNIVVRGHVKLKNFGQSPALRAYAMLGVTDSFDHLGQLMQTTCQSAKNSFEKGLTNKDQPEQVVLGASIFPAQELATGFTAADTVLVAPSGPIMAACVYYQDQRGSTRHTQTCLIGNYSTTPQSLQFCPWYNDAN